MNWYHTDTIKVLKAFWTILSNADCSDLYFIEKKTLFIRKIVTKNKYFSNEYLF